MGNEQNMKAAVESLTKMMTDGTLSAEIIVRSNGNEVFRFNASRATYDFAVAWMTRLAENAACKAEGR